MANLLLLNLVLPLAIAVILFAGLNHAVKYKAFQRNEKTGLATEFSKDPDKELVKPDSRTWRAFLSSSTEPFYRVEREISLASATGAAFAAIIDKPIHFQYLFHSDPPKMVAVMVYVNDDATVRPVLKEASKGDTSVIPMKAGTHQYEIDVKSCESQPTVKRLD